MKQHLVDRRLASWAWGVCGLATFALAGGATAGTTLGSYMEPFHVEMAKRFDGGRATGAILTDEGALGSAVVINPGDVTGDGFDDFTDSIWVLTAAHVINGSDGFWFGTGDDINDLIAYRAAEWYIPNTYNGAVVQEADIALVRLDRGIANNIPRMNLLQPTGPQDQGQDYTRFGYGLGGPGDFFTPYEPSGIKRAGRNVYDGTVGSNQRILSSDFDIDPDDDAYVFEFYEPYYADLNGIPFEDWITGEVNTRRSVRDYRIPYEYSAAPGDSGGPTVVGDWVTGITSYGTVGSLFTAQNGEVRVSQWYNWIYAVIQQVHRGETPIGFAGDGVLVGSQGNGVIAGVLGADGTNATEAVRANYRRTAQLLKDYFTEGQGVDLEGAMELLNLTPSASTIAAYAAALGIDPADLDTDPSVAEQQLLDAAYAQLETSLDPSLKYVAQGDIGEFGFFLGTTQVGTPTQQWGGGSSDGVDLSDYFDFIDTGNPQGNYLYGDVNVNGSLEVGDIDTLYAMINVGGDAAFDPHGDLDFSGSIAHPDVDALVYDVFNTTYGDADLDGDVDFDDAAALVLNYTGSDGEAEQITWSRANFDGDTNVDFSDAVVLRVNYTGSDAAQGGDLASAVGTEVSLLVDVTTGQIQVLGDGTLLKGVSITSLSGALAALAGDAATAGVFTLSDSANEYAMIAINGLLIDGGLVLDAAFAGGPTDLGFRYITDSGVFTGQVSYVPEPVSAMGALGLMLLARRRRA